MSTNTSYATRPVGRMQRVIVQTESSDLGEAITAWSGAKYIRHLNDGVITDAIPDIRADAKRGYLDQIAGDRVAGKHDATFSIEASLRPSGSAGTAPDVGPLLVAAGMTETVDAGVSVTYAPANDQSTSLHVLEDLESVSRLLVGGFVESVTLELTGTDPAKVTGSGRGTTPVRTGYTTLSGTEAADQTELSVAELNVFEVGGWVRAGSDDNSGAGYKITAKSAETGAGTITVTPALAVGADSGDAVGPFCPTPSAVGTLLPVTAGSITIDGNAVDLVDATLTITNTIWDDRDRVATDRIRNRRITAREQSLELGLYLARGSALVRRLTSGVLDVAITLGDTAGYRLKVNVDRFRVTDAGPVVEVSENAVMLRLTGICEGSSGNDGFSLVLD